MPLRRGIVLGVALLAIVAKRAAAQGPVVISDVTVVDATGAAPRPHMVVAVEGGRIVAIVPASSWSPVSDARIVDGRAKFLIPGLWDMHVHLDRAGGHTLPLWVANGITSVRDVGGDFALVTAMREEIAAGSRVGPRIRTAGPMLESQRRVERQLGRMNPEYVRRARVPVPDTTRAARVVDSIRNLGADFIKFRTVQSTETYRAIAAAARRAGLPLVGHGDAVPVDEMVKGGQRAVEHVIVPPLHWRDATERRRLVRRLVAGNVAFVPTVVNFHRFFMVRRDDASAIIADSLGLRDRRRRYVCCELIEHWQEQLEDLGGKVSIRRPLLRALYGAAVQDLRDLHRAGAVIMPGTDVGVAMIYPGFSLHDELGYFVSDIGMSPMQALISATRAPAEWFGLRDSLGTIEVGKIADLVLLDADPIADIRHTRRVAGVMLRGRYYDREELDALLEGAAREVRARR